MFRVRIRVRVSVRVRVTFTVRVRVVRGFVGEGEQCTMGCDTLNFDIGTWTKGLRVGIAVLRRGGMAKSIAI